MNVELYIFAAIKYYFHIRIIDKSGISIIVDLSCKAGRAAEGWFVSVVKQFDRCPPHESYLLSPDNIHSGAVLLSEIHVLLASCAKSLPSCSAGRHAIPQHATLIGVISENNIV